MPRWTVWLTSSTPSSRSSTPCGRRTPNWPEPTRDDGSVEVEQVVEEAALAPLAVLRIVVAAVVRATVVVPIPIVTAIGLVVPTPVVHGNSRGRGAGHRVGGAIDDLVELAPVEPHP